MHRADPYRTNRPEWDQAALFPRRRKTRPQDIDLEPPDIRDVLGESWRRHQPRLLRIGRFIRENWILLAGVAAAAVGIAMLDAGHRETVERARADRAGLPSAAR